MPKNVLCDFCLEEGKGFFHQPEEIAGGHHICAKCRKILEENGLPLRHELFQILVTADPQMRPTIMTDYCDTHSVADICAKYYPMPSILMHKGEHCINVRNASITVLRKDLPTQDAVKQIMDVDKTKIQNISDGFDGDLMSVVGKLVETDVALYFMSDHFVNCHRPTHIQKAYSTNETLCVKEKNKVFTYHCDTVDLFFLRHQFYQKVMAYKQEKHQNLIYIHDDNAMVITPGVYHIPTNILVGTYQVEPIEDTGLTFQYPNGKVVEFQPDQQTLELTSGMTLECAGEYKLIPIHQEFTQP